MTAATVDFGAAAPAGTPAATHEDMHLLPCKIDMNGVSDVPMYFVPQPAAGAPGAAAGADKTAAFRGRELQGQVLRCGGAANPHYDAYVVTNPCTALNDWQATQRVESFTHWSRDVDPSSQTVGVKKLLDEWPLVAGSISMPVSDADIEEQLKFLDERGKGSAATAAVP